MRIAGASAFMQPAMPVAGGTVLVHAGDVHVWRSDLDVQTPDKWSRILCGDEFGRAARFLRYSDRNRFLQMRFNLRMLLAAYLKAEPCELEFDQNEHGKPGLLRHDLAFNVSHSRNLGVVAISGHDALGIDVECVTLPSDARRLAQQVFSEEECEHLSVVPNDALAISFFTGWTRKEAYLKALGTGLARDPRSVTTGLFAARSKIRDPHSNKAVEVETIAAGNDAVLSLAVVGNARKRLDAVCVRNFDPNTPEEDI